MTMAYYMDGVTDIPVEILGYPASGKVRIRSLIGWPFGEGHRSAKRPVERHSQKVAVVDQSKVRVVQDG